MKLMNNVQGRHHELQQVKAHVLGGDPTLDASMAGEFWYDSVAKKHRGWDGTAAHNLTNLVEQVLGSGAVSAVLSGKQVTVSIAAASQTVPGTMSSADKVKLDSAGIASTPNSLVQRDGNGDFAAGTITASLTGTASNAAALGGQTLAQVRDFAQTTGQRTALSAISDFNTAVRLNRLDQIAVPTGPVQLNGQRLAAVADPVSAQDAATKNYVDSVATGLDPKASVKYATAAALPASVYANGSAGVGATLTASANGLLGTVGGGTPADGERILVKNQASAGQNGIYVVTTAGSAGTTWVLTRATDADSSIEVTGGMFTFVEAGTLAATGWVLNATGVITLGTTAQTFAQFSGAGTYLNGNGLSLTGSTFAVVGTTNRVSVSGSGVDIAATYAGQASITTLGTVATGTWQATAVAVAYGGTGAGTAAGARTNLGATGKNAGLIPAGTSYTFPHGLNTLDVIVGVIEVATGDFVEFDITVMDANNVRVASASAVAAGAYRVVVVG